MNLSSLPRAALATKEGYLWINAIALALSCVIAWMSWDAYSAAGQPDRALVCIVSQGLAIALAILGRRALTGQMPLAALASAVLAGGCAWWASHGLALAWYDNAERNGEPMVIFMAALEPALFLLAEHVKEGRETLRAAHEKAEAETASELAAIRAREAARHESPRLATQDGIALGAGALATVASGVSESLPMASAHGRSVSEPSPIVSDNLGYASAREHAVALKSNNMALTQDEIAAKVGKPRSTVGKWLREAGIAKAMTPLQDAAA